MKRMVISLTFVSLCVALLVACGNKPVTPDWQMNAQGSMERFVSAYLSGNARVESLEFERARGDLSRTGRPELLARAELLRCAARVASLVVETCAGFEALRQDAAPAERAYADYLSGKGVAQDAALLPEAQRAVMSGGDAALAAIKDPLSQLVAAGVLFQAGKASPVTISTAVDTASAQGWRRPLLAWLLIQAQRAELGGATDEAARIRRRISVVEKAGKP